MSLQKLQDGHSLVSSDSSAPAYDSYSNAPAEGLGFGGEFELVETAPGEPKKHISVGDSLPYGPRLYYKDVDNVVRMKDIGEKNRIILLGVLGSFTPDCWNRHFFRVLHKIRYFSEREIDYICCVSTNDAFTQKAWGEYLGCEDSVMMWGDPTKRFTMAMGMDVVLPWLDNNVRSKRYVIYAEDMVVSKMEMSHLDGPALRWDCGHLEVMDEEGDSDSSSWI